MHTRWTDYAVGAASVPTYRDAVLTIFRDYESCTTVTGQKMFSKAFTESEKKLKFGPDRTLIKHHNDSGEADITCLKLSNS